MTYSLEEFRNLHKSFMKNLIDGESGDALSCRLHQCGGAKGGIEVPDPDGRQEDFHVAEACNIANVIDSIGIILKLPRSNVASRALSEVLLLRLDVLREYIRAAFSDREYSELDADKVIRLWAGFLKHPCDYVFAHRCSSVWSIAPPVEITSEFLREWDGLSISQKDRKKSELANVVVAVHLPSFDEIDQFFISCKQHLEGLIRQASTADESRL